MNGCEWRADLGLAVHGGGEHLALLGGDGGVALNEGSVDSSKSLDAKRERRHVEQQHVLDLSGKNSSLGPIVRDAKDARDACRKEGNAAAGD